MTTITLPRAVAQQTLGLLLKVEAELKVYYTTETEEVRVFYAAITALKAALAEPTVKESLQVPAEVAATLTSTDLAWLETRRLTKLWQELGQMRWAGADEGWDCAIEAVRNRLDKECQAVLDWKAKVDQSNATAIELLQKMQGLKDE